MFQLQLQVFENLGFYHFIRDDELIKDLKKNLLNLHMNTKKHKTTQGKLLDKVNESKELIWNSLFDMEKINKLMNPNKYIFNHMFSNPSP